LNQDIDSSTIKQGLKRHIDLLASAVKLILFCILKFESISSQKYNQGELSY